MDPYVIPLLALARLVTDIKTNLLDGGEFGLYVNDVAPTIDTVIGDLTEATFTGYARATVTTFSAVYYTGEDYAATNSPLASFAPASPYTVTEIVYGWFYLDANGDLAMAGRFAVPQPMDGPGELIELVVRFVQGNPAV